MRKLLKSFFEQSSAPNPWKKHSYSQCAEDLLIDYVFKLRGIHLPSYIDIGANHPYNLSNTALFYEKGSRGINIEANFNLISQFKIDRPLDINLNVAIGAKEEVLSFYMISESTLSTFSEQEANAICATGQYRIEKVLPVQLVTLDSVLQQYNHGIYPDFMTLDVEGLDYEILKTLSFEKSSPKVICVEAAEYSPIGAGARRTELIDLLTNQGYYEYANTNLNAILVRRDFWFI